MKLKQVAVMLGTAAVTLGATDDISQAVTLLIFQ
jgi:hypothetical protein